MNDVYDFLVAEVFIGFLKQAPELLEEINRFEGDLKIFNNSLIFTLPALFELTCKHFNNTYQTSVPTSRVNYLQFRKQLYTNATNTLLQQNGGVVEVDTPDKEHDKSRYRLVFIRDSDLIV